MLVAAGADKNITDKLEKKPFDGICDGNAKCTDEAREALTELLRV